MRAVSKDIMKETIKGGITGFKRNSLFEKDHTMRLGVSNRGFKSRLEKRLGSELETTERLKGCFGAQLIVSDLCIPMQLFTTGTTSIDFQVDAKVILWISIAVISERIGIVQRKWRKLD